MKLLLILAVVVACANARAIRKEARNEPEVDIRNKRAPFSATIPSGYYTYHHYHPEYPQTLHDLNHGPGGQSIYPVPILPPPPPPPPGEPIPYPNGVLPPGEEGLLPEGPLAETGPMPMPMPGYGDEIGTIDYGDLGYVEGVPANGLYGGDYIPESYGAEYGPEAFEGGYGEYGPQFEGGYGNDYGVAPYGGDYGVEPYEGGYGGDYGTLPYEGGYGNDYGVGPYEGGYGNDYGVGPYGGDYGVEPYEGGYGGEYGPQIEGGYGSDYALEPYEGGYGNEYGPEGLEGGYGADYGVQPFEGGYGGDYGQEGFGGDYGNYGEEPFYGDYPPDAGYYGGENGLGPNSYVGDEAFNVIPPEDQYGEGLEGEYGPEGFEGQYDEGLESEMYGDLSEGLEPGDMLESEDLDAGLPDGGDEPVPLGGEPVIYPASDILAEPPDFFEERSSRDVSPAELSDPIVGPPSPPKTRRI